MSNSVLQRNYLITDSKLSMFSSMICSFLERDLSELLDFGVTQEKISALNELIDEFKVFPTDSYVKANVMEATVEKLEKELILQKTFRQMGMRVAFKWGEKSSKYKRFGVSGMNRFSDAKLLDNARAAVTFLNEVKDELAETGLTQAMLNDFEAECNDFEAAKNKQKEMIELRANKAAERISKGNAIYEIVSKYCEIGKNVFAHSNPARYNDYLIYKRRRWKKVKREEEKEGIDEHSVVSQNPS